MRRLKKQPPSFKSAEEEARFWESHDSAEFELEEVDEPVILSPLLQDRILKRWEKMRATEWLPLPKSQARRLKMLARRKKISWELMVYQWLEEKLRSESAR
jgi:hypothetical protein